MFEGPRSVDPLETSLGAAQLVRALLPLAQQGRATSAQLVEIGSYLGFSDNAIRIALTRLQKSGAVTAVERGVYEVGDAEGPVAKVVDRWRLGARREAPWDGTWWGVMLPRTRPSRTARRRSLRALFNVGAAEVLDDLWVRPAQPVIDETFGRALRLLGLEDEAVEVRLRPKPDEAEAWKSSWDVQTIDAGYQILRRDVLAHLQDVEEQPGPDVLRHSFLLGQAWIRQLAFDPLLPWSDGDGRQAAVEALVAYDRAAWDPWSKALAAAGVEFDDSPEGRAFYGLHYVAVS